MQSSPKYVRRQYKNFQHFLEYYHRDFIDEEVASKHYLHDPIYKKAMDTAV